MLKNLNLRGQIALGLCVTFLLNIVGPCPIYASAYAIEGTGNIAQAEGFVLPAPGQMVALSPSFSPVVLKGIKLDPKNPFRFHFFVDRGESSLSQEALKEESAKLIKYFLASLTIPEKDLWVNLSPYEKDRIVPQEFGQTEMGRDLLAEDYLLKQITASLIYPESQLGKEFWNKVYAQAQANFGTTNIPVNTFNKVWIVPEKAVVYENGGVAFVLENHLKVMLEQDYLSLAKHEGIQSGSIPVKDTNQLGSQIVREIVIPALTKEVNEGKNFAQLRQVFYSLILATWYKKKIKDSILNKVYSNQNKIGGVNVSAADKDRIYQEYLVAFKKGVYNYIKDEPDQITERTVSRKYFAGGVFGAQMDAAMSYVGPGQVNRLQKHEINRISGRIEDVSGDAAMNIGKELGTTAGTIQDDTEMKDMRERNHEINNIIHLLVLTLEFNSNSGETPLGTKEEISVLNRYILEIREKNKFFVQIGHSQSSDGYKNYFLTQRRTFQVLRDWFVMNIDPQRNPQAYQRILELLEIAVKLLKTDRDYFKIEKVNYDLKRLFFGIVQFLSEEPFVKIIQEYDLKGEVPIDPQAFGYDVILNLLKNAKEAIIVTKRHDGEIKITARMVKENAQDEVEIIITDNGVGMTPENLARIRNEESFTTKETGNGIGLGVVRHVIREHGGNLSIDSQLGKGTTFTIRLPIDKAMTEEKRKETKEESMVNDEIENYRIIESIMEQLEVRYAAVMDQGRILNIKFFADDPIFKAIKRAHAAVIQLRKSKFKAQDFQKMRSSLEWIKRAVDYLALININSVNSLIPRGAEGLKTIAFKDKDLVAYSSRDAKEYLDEKYKTISDVLKFFESHDGLLKTNRAQLANIPESTDGAMITVEDEIRDVLVLIKKEHYNLHRYEESDYDHIIRPLMRVYKPKEVIRTLVEFYYDQKYAAPAIQIHIIGLLKACFSRSNFDIYDIRDFYVYDDWIKKASDILIDEALPSRSKPQLINVMNLFLMFPYMSFIVADKFQNYEDNEHLYPTPKEEFVNLQLVYNIFKATGNLSPFDNDWYQYFLSNYPNIDFDSREYFALFNMLSNRANLRLGNATFARVIILLGQEIREQDFNRNTIDEYLGYIKMLIYGPSQTQINSLVRQVFSISDREASLKAATRIFWLAKFGYKQSGELFVQLPEDIKNVVEEEWRIKNLEIEKKYSLKPLENSAMVTQEQKVVHLSNTGGIDLNPAQMSMQVKNGPQDFKFDFNGTEIDAAQVTGATFTIRTMAPVTDLPLELGFTSPIKEEALAKA